MPVKIRLQRHGKKGKPFYQVVVADSRAPRDGRFIERLGTYNPNTNPATIELDVAKSVQWLEKGAQPTDTARSILSYKGALYRRHLEVGVRKGALTQEEAEAKFAEWLQSKEARIDAKRSKLSSSAEEIEKARKAAETKKKEERAKAIAARNTPPAEETETPEAEASAEEAPEAATEAAAEAPAEDAEAETPAEDAKAEAPAEESPASGEASGEEKEDKKAE